MIGLIVLLAGVGFIAILGVALLIDRAIDHGAKEALKSLKTTWREID